jgi:hypothetical protein
VKQFTVKTATAKSQGLFLNVLAAAIKSCDSEELPQVLLVVNDLLAANPAARRDFFIQKSLIPCLDEMNGAISSQLGATSCREDRANVKNFIENDIKFSAINKFCLENKMQCVRDEIGQAKSLSLKAKQLGVLVPRIMYCAITSPESERDSYLQYLQNMRSSYLKIKVDEVADVCFHAFDAMHGDFTSLLGCFGKNREEQVRNFDALVDGMRGVSIEAYEEGQKEQIACYGSNRSYDTDTVEKKFKQKEIEFLFKNPELTLAALRMLKIGTRGEFEESIFRPLINCSAKGAESVSDVFSSVARQTMKNAMQPNSGSLSDEQAQLLCEGVNLPELLRTERVVGKNIDTIDMILRFIQDRAFDSTNPRISFEDIMSENISPEICQRLQAFVEGESRNYDQRLVDFIRNGVAQRTAH